MQSVNLLRKSILRQWGSDSYNALQLALTRRFNTGVTLNAQYTFSKSFGLTSGSNESRTAAQPVGGSLRSSGDQNNYEADRGYNSFDVRHTMNLSAVYDLPIGKGKRLDWGGIGNAVFGGWEIGTIFNARSGLPIDVTITRSEVAAVCASAGGCTVNTSATATTVAPQGFTVQLPSISGAQPLPAGFTAVVNAPGGGASRQTRRPNLLAGVSPYLNNDRNFLNPSASRFRWRGSSGTSCATR